MELRELAERILFATTLEEKLRSPARVTDERPGSPIVAPSTPGRPAGLQFKQRGTARDVFPGIGQLEKERERGRLLHFFANHELLATELMALVLLRFPDAPAAFRKGVLQTLRDEQEHTRWYLQRMKECGIEFGELPVSGYFWRAVSGMENPIDYVAGLSLTFEQANLDFARHFAKGFAHVGDQQTATLLERIYRDEIGHVAYGLKWFRRWKNPNESDWEAFCRQLKFPLSPQRAKGVLLNIEGRRAAGLDPAFIAELCVYSQSRGRTPNVFVFNPLAEMWIAQGKSFTPTKHQAQLQRDLENLPQFLCRQDDLVLVQKRPSLEFLSGIQQAGFALPEFVEWEAAYPLGSTGSSGRSRPSACSALRERKLGRLRPWAWAPDSVELFKPLFANLTAEKRTADQSFNPGIAELYSKAWSAARLKRIVTAVSRESTAASAEDPNCALTRDRHHEKAWLCAEDDVGVAVGSLNEAIAVITAIRARGHHKIVVKEAIGLAGHNAMRLWEPELLENQRRWMENALTNGRQLVVEPWLERELDFSVQLEMSASGLKVAGWTGLINDRKGQFQANWAAPNCNRGIPSRIIDLFDGPRDVFAQIRQLYEGIFEQLGAELKQVGYIGPVGIDAFVYRTPAGDCRLKPIVEINPRYTMGRVLVELMKQAAPGTFGMFRLVNPSRARAHGFDDLVSCARSLTQRFPLQLEGEPIRRIREGVLCLNDPATARVCLATFQVADTLEKLLGNQRLPL